jgi:hypothetical protein
VSYSLLHGRLRRFLSVFVVSLVMAAAAHATSAAAAAPWWHLASSSVPTNLAPGGEGTIVLQATNLGDATVSGATTPVTISDKLPPGLSATAISGLNGIRGFRGKLECSLPALTCTLTGPEGLPPYEQLEVSITVKVGPGASAGEVNEANVTGGEVPSASVTQQVMVSAPSAQFGIERYELAPESEGGVPETQAGSHPFQVTTTLGLNQVIQTNHVCECGRPMPSALPKDLRFNLPPGMIGNPSATPRCSELDFTAFGQEATNFCPPNTAVGVASATVDIPSLGAGGLATVPVPLFNLEPAPGEPARFGFVVEGVPVTLDTSIRTGGDYGVVVRANNISQAAGFLASKVTFWGVPGDSRHDQSRGWPCIDGGIFSLGQPCTPLGQRQPVPFLTLPTSCTGPLQTSVVADSWVQPDRAIEQTYTFQDGSGHPFGLDGCNRLAFQPSIAVAPEGQAASTPTGLDVHVHVPQEAALTTTGLAESHVKNTTVTLPQGIQVSPAAADGLQSCSTAQIALEGPGPATCPKESKVGTVEVKTPLLPDPLVGGAYLAAQNANPFGSLLALYIVAEDPKAGVIVKLAGRVTPDPVTGQLVSTFENTPQLPFEDLELRFFSGARAPLTTPAFCGTYTTSASFTPWSGNASVSSLANLEITSGPNGSSCPSQLPFTPSLVAGSGSLQAGAFTPFTTTMSREDGNQNLGAVSLHLPPGLLGMLSAVELCGEPQASEGTCAPASVIGHTVVSVGLGSDPYTVSGGKVFITGPYKGAPYGLSIAEPAKAGPFDLGSGRCDCVVVRARIDVDRRTSALTVTSDALPTILDGIPLQIKQVNVATDRPGFTFNPTNCSPLTITATILSIQGVAAPASVPFRVANCATLPFKPKFAVLTSAHTSKGGGAYLHVKVASGTGQANIGKVRVELPKELPSRLSTLQKACPVAVFEANPATCPEGSIVGTAWAATPVLKNALTGPAYLVSHAAAAFPDLEIVLQGEGVTLLLDGQTDIKKGITSSTFNSVPDAPVTSFDLVLPEGPHSALGAFGSLCKGKLTMPTVLTGQNGALVKQATRVAVSGCHGATHRTTKAKHNRHKPAKRQSRQRQVA